MSSKDFEALEDALARSRDEGFRHLIARFIEEKNYPAAFEARLMRKRLELGLPAIQSGPLGDLSEQVRAEYEAEQIAAARETGELFLADGQIHRAWPYFRALGESDVVARAIERFDAPPGDERVDGVVEIAYHERVHPRKGFELILKHYGICRAITNFSHYPAEEGRAEAARLLAESLSADLRTKLKRAVRSVEDREVETDDIAEIVRDRPWLFDGGVYYIDTSHVSSVAQMAVDWDDPVALRLALGLCEYGRRLDPMYRLKGDPPFENLFEDVGFYLKALLGEDVEASLDHFRRKLAGEADPFGDLAAQRFVQLLARLGRYPEAIDTAVTRLADVDRSRLICPTALELCQLAGDRERMARIARETQDPLALAAALAS